MPHADAARSLPGLLFACAREHPDRPLFRTWRDGVWVSLSWGGFVQQVAAVSAGLVAAGVQPGDRVLLVSENRPEFPIAETALMCAGAVTVPTYTTNTAADHVHILRDSGARAAIVSTPALAACVGEAARATGGLDLLVVMEDPPAGAVPWQRLLDTPADAAKTMAAAEQIPPGRLACLVYTSGTGGLPKGVMLPHRAMLANRAGVRDLIHRLGIVGDRYLSFLPLSHAYEHTVGGFLLPSFGIEVVYSRGADRIAAEFQEIQPGIVTAVPRLFEVLRARILAGLAKESALKRGLFERALALGLRRMDGPPLGLLDRAQDAVLERLVRDKVRARFGGRLRALVSGGARLDPGLSGFFLALGLPVIQGYGQTEAGPVVSVNAPWDNKRHSVGPPIEGADVTIAEDGEVLVRGELVMDGYWQDPEATARALKPGPGGHTWLHTGDVGAFDGRHLVITDRKRDFLKTLGGDMVSPARIEALLMAEPEIAQAVAVGEGEPAIGALIVPAEDADRAAVDAAVRRVNAGLSSIERVRRFALVPPFTIENGLLTPTMKQKRRQIWDAHTEVLAGLQREGTIP
jgi:long-chain acyl-CoA synthetase